MSSSDEVEDEHLKQILEATDTSLFTNKLYEQKCDPTQSKQGAFEVLNKEEDTPKSQRYLDVDDSFERDLKIPQSMQDHIAKKLSAAINSQVEFVIPQESEEDKSVFEKKLKKKWKSTVRLLNDFEVPVKYMEETRDPNEMVQKKPSIQRRIIEPDGIDEAEKIRLSAVSPSAIISGDELKSWVKRKSKKIFHYKKAKSGDILHFVEPENEFTVLRKKNCWSEKYIAKNKRK